MADSLIEALLVTRIADKRKTAEAIAKWMRQRDMTLDVYRHLPESQRPKFEERWRDGRCEMRPVKQHKRMRTRQRKRKYARAMGGSYALERQLDGAITRDA